tara:strand:- start:47 stop:751 length:705 start_codon:yes stop_codon:yes gene_type:complete
MRIQIFQHVHFEGPGHIETWAIEHGHTFLVTKLYNDDPLPDLDDVDALVVMGGPMGIYDDHRYPWLRKEKSFLLDFIETKKPIIGICLGSQLIAHVLRTPVYRNREPELGWFPVYFTAGSDPVVDKFNERTIDVFHWHRDAFDLPYGATKLAESNATQVQMYLLDRHILGILCHLEMSPNAIEKLLENARSDLADGGTFVQNEKKIIELSSEKCEATKIVLFRLLDRFFEIAKL